MPGEWLTRPGWRVAHFISHDPRPLLDDRDGRWAACGVATPAEGLRPDVTARRCGRCERNLTTAERSRSVTRQTRLVV